MSLHQKLVVVLVAILMLLSRRALAFTPSLGVALGVQDTIRENGATAFDAATKSTWAQLAPGVAFSVSFVELRGRVRVPLDGSQSPTMELGLGIFF